MPPIINLQDCEGNALLDTPQLLTPPSTHPSSPEPTEPTDETSHPKKAKKKKKKPKKTNATNATIGTKSPDTGPPPLCISRNKHWRYISSYHGPWLQLPVELLDSLLVVNKEASTMRYDRPWSADFSSTDTLKSLLNTPTPLRLNDRSLSEEDGQSANLRLSLPSSTLNFGGDTIIPPPPVDDGVFQSVINIRRLIDEASELSVRSSSGLSAAALNSMRRGDPNNPFGNSGGGRNVPMSATRIHRLRALACEKLAAAYKQDEIAASVMVMQGGSLFDDIATRVLKVDPHDVNAIYVHFFHEKIPSRQVAEYTTTRVLDEIIAVQPHRLEFYRTRGIVHCFRDDYALANRDFTYVIKESRAERKMRMAHRTNVENGGRKRKKNGKSAGINGFQDFGEGDPDAGALIHATPIPDAPDAIETQCLFLRGSAFLQHAVFQIENAALALEEIPRTTTVDGLDLRLSGLRDSRYGGVESAHPDGPLGARFGPKATAYRALFAAPRFRDQITLMASRAVRDLERFIDTFETRLLPAYEFEGNQAERVTHAFQLCETHRPASAGKLHETLNEPPCTVTTYHPLLLEAHFCILLAKLILGDFADVMHTFVRCADIVDGLEGYPIFLPPRSMAHAEFTEILERLSAGWRNGTRPHSLNRNGGQLVRRGKGAAIAPMISPPSPALSTADPSPPMLGSASSSSNSLLRQNSEDPSTPAPVQVDKRLSLDAARMLLAPMVQRRKQKADLLAEEKRLAALGEPVKPSLQIPLHGPRVDVILAWLGAVPIPELDNVPDI